MIKRMIIIVKSIVFLWNNYTGDVDDGDAKNNNDDDGDNLAVFSFVSQAIIQDKSYSLWARESYDWFDNKMRMDLLINGLEQGLLIDYTNNTYVLWAYQSVDKKDYTCTIEKLDEVQSDNLDVFGFKLQKSSSGSSIPHVVSAPEVLQ